MRKKSLIFSAQSILGTGILGGVVLAAILAGGYAASGSPLFCGACHSMEHVSQRLALTNHKQFACIECHLPHAVLPVQLAYKARAGLNDLFHETLRDYPAAILLSAEGRRILQGNCLRCHLSTIENTPMAGAADDCTRCHRYLAHGRGLEKGGIRVE